MWDRDRGTATEPLLKHRGEDYGRRHDDPHFKGVKEEGRKCNDILFGILFIIAVVGMVSISSFAFSKGQPEKLIPSWEFGQVNITATAEQKSELWFQDAVAQLKNDRYILLGALGLAIFLALSWVQLIKMFTKLFIYLTLTLGVLVVLALATYVVTYAHEKSENNLKIVGYCIYGIAGLIIIAIIFLRKRIALTCELFKECCAGVQWNPAIFLVSGIVIGLFALFTVFWVSSFVYLYSVPADEKYRVPYAPPKFDQSVRNLMYYQIFGYFWVTSFMSAVFQMSIAGAIATWYFSRDVNGFGRDYGSPALRSFARSLTYSFGSLAFGSLILAIIKMINFILKIAEKKNKATKNVVMQYILKCVQCIFACLQRLVQFINKFTYVSIAMHGDGFCSSARSVFNLMSRNYFSAAFVDILGEFVLFVGKLLGTAACTIFTMAIVHGLGRQLTSLTLSVVAIVAYIVFTIFAHIIGTGVDTVFVCYLEDLERNKDHGSLYVTPSLHKLLAQKQENNKHTVNN